MCDLRSEFQRAPDYAGSRIHPQKFKGKFQKEFGKWFESDAKWDKVLDGAQAYCSVGSATKDTDRYIIATPGKIIRMNQKDNFLRMMFGLAICGNNEQRSVAIIYGVGTSNGKSTLLKAGTDTLGDYAVVTQGVAIDETREGNGATPDTIATKGKRMVCVHEINQGVCLDAGKIKQIASEDHMSGREVFQGAENVVLQCVLFMDCKALPLLLPFLLRRQFKGGVAVCLCWGQV